MTAALLPRESGAWEALGLLLVLAVLSLSLLSPRVRSWWDRVLDRIEEGTR